MVLNPQQLKEVITSTTSEDINTFLPLISSNLSKEETEKAIAPIINNLLAGGNRSKGLIILDYILEYCSDSILNEYGSNWCSYCIGGNINNDKTTKLSILEKMLKMTVNCDAFNKKFLQDHVPDLLKITLLNNGGEKTSLLRCLSLCMVRFPAWFGNHRDKIEPFLMGFLENSNRRSVQVAALAFHYFQQTGNAGSDGVNHSNNFSKQTKRLCASIHSLFDGLLGQFQEITNFQRIDCDVFVLDSSKSSYIDWKTIDLACTELENLIAYLRTMITEQFSAAKLVVLEYFINVITRGLSFHECASHDAPLDRKFLLNRFCNVHIELLQLLRALFTGFASALLPFNVIISKMLINCIKRFNTCECFPMDYQKTSYEIMIDWISSSNGHFSPNQLESLITILIANITPQKKQIALSLTPQNKKKTKKNPLVIIGKDEFISQAKTKARITTCNHSLRTLATVCNHSPLIKRENLKECINLCVKLITDVQSNRSALPYSEEICQISLYELLVAFLNQETARYLLPMNLVVALFDQGLRNERFGVRKACRNGLVIAEMICQPVCAPLGFEQHDGREETVQTSHLLAEKQIQPEVISSESDEGGETIVGIPEVIKVPSVGLLELGDKKDTRNTSLEIIDIDSESAHDEENDKEGRIGVVGDVDDEEPPEKRHKQAEIIESDSNINDMFESFQDIVQE